MAEGKEEPVYATYKGLGYVSMFMGVPLYPLLILFGVGTMGGLILLLTVGAWGLLCPLLCGAILMFLKVLCESDNKAMERAKWSWKSWQLRLRHGSKILVVSPNKSRSKDEHVRTCLKKIHRTG
ncbi:hypothetical protein PS623_04353 [Pseudomonas fluorescens]|nr:hypothetical protein PS623_04353 [Pseudomonas fluorescens]